MSVATSTRYFPALNPASAFVRCGCERFPWMRSAAMPFRVKSLHSRSARCLVRVKTSASSMRPPFRNSTSSAPLRVRDTG